jgi:hypothetical protein
MTIENNEENREKLAQLVVDSMEFEDMVDWIKSRLKDDYANIPKSFEEDWKGHVSGDE